MAKVMECRAKRWSSDSRCTKNLRSASDGHVPLGYRDQHPSVLNIRPIEEGSTFISFRKGDIRYTEPATLLLRDPGKHGQPHDRFQRISGSRIRFWVLCTTIKCHRTARDAYIIAHPRPSLHLHTLPRVCVGLPALG